VPPQPWGPERHYSAWLEPVLYKILYHNLTCLILEQETLGIVPVFWKDEAEETGEPVILPMFG
jgi:hypothetical protein